MAEAQATDANITEVSSAPVIQTEVTPTPAGEAPVVESPEEKAVPYSRFKEMVDQKNDGNRQMEELRTEFRSFKEAHEVKPKSGFDSYVSDLVDNEGIDEKSARIVAKAAHKIALDVTAKEVGVLRQAQAQREVTEWKRDFKRDHTDYDKLEPEMYKIYQQLPENTKGLIASDPAGLELLYSHVKMQSLEKDMSEKVEQGKSEAYKTQQVKTAVASGTSGSAQSTASPLTRDSVKRMSLSEYEKRRPEIMSLLSQGKL